MKIIDLSHEIHAGMAVYPGMPSPKIDVLLGHGQASGHYSLGTSFQIAGYNLGGNTGTYLDSPFHRFANGVDLAGLSLEKLVNLEGVVVSALGRDAIDSSAFSGIDLRGKAVLVRTDWSLRWDDAEDYFRSGPFLTRDACELLTGAGATLVGIDCANIDSMQDPDRPAHTVLLRAGIPIVEHLCHLDALPRDGFSFHAAPPAIRNGTSFPVRAFAIVG
jgi:kynurenine formamidase